VRRTASKPENKIVRVLEIILEAAEIALKLIGIIGLGLLYVAVLIALPVYGTSRASNTVSRIENLPFYCTGVGKRLRAAMIDGSKVAQYHGLRVEARTQKVYEFNQHVLGANGTSPVTATVISAIRMLLGDSNVRRGGEQAEGPRLTTIVGGATKRSAAGVPAGVLELHHQSSD
jgi:hypothetical protein